MPTDRGANAEHTKPPSQVAVVERGPAIPAALSIDPSFARMYERVYARAIDSAMRFVDYDTACEALHEATFELWHRWDQLAPERRSVRTFIVAVHYRVIDHLRRQQRYVEIDQALEEFPEIALPEVAEESDVAEIVDRVVASMPDRCREVFILISEQQLTYQEVAEALGISVASVATHMRNAYTRLREGFARAGRLSQGVSPKLLAPPASEDR